MTNDQLVKVVPEILRRHDKVIQLVGPVVVSQNVEGFMTPGRNLGTCDVVPPHILACVDAREVSRVRFEIECWMLAEEPCNSVAFRQFRRHGVPFGVGDEEVANV